VEDVATSDQIAAFRLLIDEKEDKHPYDDVSLSTRLDGAASVAGLAKEVWLEKAAVYASLVNVSESGSSRSMSDLHKNALAMSKALGEADASAPGTGTAVRGVRMKRLTRS
jgi:hypothetical protein